MVDVKNYINLTRKDVEEALQRWFGEGYTLVSLHPRGACLMTSGKIKEKLIKYEEEVLKNGRTRK